MVQETRPFPIGDVLSITTGHLVSHDGALGYFKILDWMTGQPLMHHQLGRAEEAARPVILALYPQLAQIVYPTYLDESEDAQFTWVDTQGELYGEWWDIPQLDRDIHEAQ